MSTPIPEFLWLRDYEQRLEFVASKRRGRAPAAVQATFLSIR